MTRVLVVATEDPHPATSGIRTRVAAMLAYLEKWAETSLLVVADRPSRVAKAVSLVRGLPDSRPVYMAYYASRAGRDAVIAAVDRARPDVVVASGLSAASVLDDAFPRANTVLDLADAEPERFRSLGQVGRPVERARWRADAGLVQRWLASHLTEFAAVTVVSRPDHDFYRRLAPTARLHLAPNGVDLPPSPRSDPGGAGAVFVGNFDYPPNRDGLKWLVADVLPRTRLLRRLRVVGRGPIANHLLIDARGFVDDLAPEWREATLSIAPIRLGGGTRLKVLEAMAHGVPVVATSVAASGIGAVAGRDYLAADEPEAFAAAIDELVVDSSRRRELAVAGRQLAANYRWEVSFTPLLDLLRELTGVGVGH